MLPDADLSTASRAELLGLIAGQQQTISVQAQTITTLQERVAALERRLGSSGGKGVPGTKPVAGSRSKASGQPRKQRPHGFARKRSQTPTSQVVHAADRCPDCATPLTGGWLKRRRELIELPLTPVRVVEHQYLARRCPSCKRTVVPKVDLDGLVVGRQRLGAGLVSLIASLREEGRLPVRTIQWYLQTLHQLQLSVGAIVAASQRLAERGAGAVDALRAELQTSAFVHADETGWRQSGKNGYAWTFCTPSLRYFVHGSRAKGMVDTVLGPQFSGVLCSDFYGAYHHYAGQKQRCWAHLLRELHELETLYPDDAGLASWKLAVQALFAEAKAFVSPRVAARRAAKRDYEQRLWALCQPHARDPAAVEARLCRRVERHLSELFVFVSEPGLPADNNAAERSLRHLVTSRKISGGTRSPLGTQTKMRLASLFGTWRARGQDPLRSAHQVLVSPQV